MVSSMSRFSHKVHSHKLSSSYISLMDQIILYTLPVFALMIAAEWAYGWKTNRNTYRLNDSISSLSQGLLSQAVAVCTKLLQIGLYSLFFKYFALHRAPAFWHSAVGWLLAVVLFDFFDYWLHRAGHEVAILWAAHVVHHQSEEFNFSTALRQESFVPIFGWIFYLPMALLGVPPEQFALAGLIVLVYQFWIHTQHIGKLGWFDRVFSSPSNHRVHHAINPQYLDKNYGGMLIIWDRLFGTFAEEDEKCVFGTKSPLTSWNPLRAVGNGYLSLARQTLQTRSWHKKVALWLMPPACLENSGADEMAPIHIRKRFDPTLGRASAVTATAVFLLMLAATAWLLLRTDDIDWVHRAIAAAAITTGLTGVGLVLQATLRQRAAMLLLCAALVPLYVSLRWSLH